MRRKSLRSLEKPVTAAAFLDDLYADLCGIAGTPADVGITHLIHVRTCCSTSCELQQKAGFVRIAAGRLPLPCPPNGSTPVSTDAELLKDHVFLTDYEDRNRASRSNPASMMSRLVANERRT